MCDLEGLTQAARDAVGLFETTLRPLGWSVVTTLTAAGVNVEVDHPLSVSQGFNFRNDDSDHLRFVRDQLELREFAVIAASPSRVEHASLIQRLRAVARANNWDPRILEVLASVLESQSVLSVEESEWLEKAGPAWADDSNEGT
jgi:hypothetical protein